MIQLVLSIATAGVDITYIINGSGGTLHTPSINWPLHRQTVTPMKPGDGITCQTTSILLVGEGGSDWVVDTPGSLVWGCQTSPPPKLWLWGLLLRPLDKGKVSLAVTMGLEGCRGLFSAGGSTVISTVASLMGVPAGVGWALLGVTSLGGMMGVSSGKAMPLNTSSSEKER